MSNYILDSQSVLLRLGLALFIGLLIGVDRDESWQKQSAIQHSRFSFVRPGKQAVGLGGVRTYTVLALLGTLLGTLYLVNTQTLPIVIVGFIGVTAYISIAYFLNFFDRHTLGLTTELGMLLLFALTFALGANLLDYKLVLGIAVIVSLISNLKVEFRKLIGSFTQKEILESVEFVAISAVVLPWLPNVTITIGQVLSLLNLSAGPFAAIALINPFQFWTVIVFISALNFVGYFLSKLTQSSSSILLTAFLGGIVSSTSVTHFLAARSKVAKTASNSKLLVAAVLLTNMTSFIRIPLIALVLNPQLFYQTIPWFLVLILLTVGISQFLRRGASKHEAPLAIFTSPLAIKPAVAFGLLFLIVSLATNIAIYCFGKMGFVVTALLASFSGLDAVSIITAKAIPDVISLTVGTSVLLGAVITNLVFKLGIVRIYGEKRFAFLSTVWLGGITLAAVLLLGIVLL
ncbi:hypothetical protein CO112_02465 [Candidatus Dojkabacteria bacterium CG_4_9_14_3_um_filter_150_Dojkabacteria_WS6_41_13]|uniref:Uncharacterized protein n=1 Tax=Candidatus Dojkabacteria bacterium CG_4_10_14_0_2_um_filter_Dojkabacteria_WS6_41_15 TaxID=2014249 RepID=A0A2M7W0X8_9BACT|nr:MAG: hypothetical protein COZ14_00550 [Candidatus Dojkabacteria bacterium CG_4_10_14_3_um_filter_Dojkabacteria_WS6_41_9]PJA12620.1 MAG: hypothetical protein COX64_04295 [Candidatus Dojkabacteria bacterium CG_4_10_14_0_2_um_filter_Dojkabacteria_WS6_41_15]PJB22790.1 MAG: hypothetical protein CO112_02465 [Candidatus Dojkabacteria bacterium CG_4_9_14_3_um_filter_150_Dojkabacteria_WS6_41_13]